MGAWIETTTLHNTICSIMSHPVWVRGLKQYICASLCHAYLVAPRVGAWIETAIAEQAAERVEVAPRVGAWIETSTHRWSADLALSHPVWVRGLKLAVSSYMDLAKMSHPVWVRGLKLCSK